MSYYITAYNLYPIYEAAEGGYYYPGVQIEYSRECQTWNKAKRVLMYAQVVSLTMTQRMKLGSAAKAKLYISANTVAGFITKAIMKTLNLKMTRFMNGILFLVFC